MGTQTELSPAYAAPAQPKPPSNPFDATYAPLQTTDGTRPPANPFALYEDGLDDDGADGSAWETEATGTRAEPRFWQPRFYAAYFDINVSDLAARLLRSMLPFKPLLGWAREEEEMEGGTSVPDLYGPVWVTTTLVLALSVGSKIAEFLMNVLRGNETHSMQPSMSSVEFSRLWRAASILYFYVFVFPVVLAIFQCLFAKRTTAESTVRAHPILASVMVYGYSMTPVVVAALVATVPVEMVQIVAMAVAFAIGAFVIMLNLWRDVSVQHRSLTYFVRLLAVLAHAGVGAALIFMFYLHR